jgi:hypothetical protein
MVAVVTSPQLLDVAGCGTVVVVVVVIVVVVVVVIVVVVVWWSCSCKL